MKIDIPVPVTVCIRCNAAVDAQPTNLFFDTKREQWGALAIVRPIGWTAGPAKADDLTSGLCPPCGSEYSVAMDEFLASSPTSTPPAAVPEPMRGYQKIGLPQSTRESRTLSPTQTTAARANHQNLPAYAQSHSSSPNVISAQLPMTARPASLQIRAIENRTQPIPSTVSPVIASATTLNQPAAIVNQAPIATRMLPPDPHAKH